jgi:alkylhydroperoxidase family enzyme
VSALIRPLDSGRVACVILAHNDPAHVRRLVSALDPFPVYLHCDARTSKNEYGAMLGDPTSRVIPLRRRPTPWAGWGLVAAELDGLREAVRDPAIDHVVVLQGSDYPLASTLSISAELARSSGLSITTAEVLPRAQWSGRGGMSRLRYRHWAVRRRMIRMPIPRRLPRGIVPAGGGLNKVLSRSHVLRILALYSERPELATFWRRTWVPDETFVNTALETAIAGEPRAQHIVARSLWFTDWGQHRQKSPAWLTDRHRERLETARSDPDRKLFARKFSTETSSDLLGFVDNHLRLDEPAQPYLE